MDDTLEQGSQTQIDEGATFQRKNVPRATFFVEQLMQATNYHKSSKNEPNLLKN